MKTNYNMSKKIQIENSKGKPKNVSKVCPEYVYAIVKIEKKNSNYTQYVL